MPAVAQCGTLSTHTTAPAGRLVFLDYLRIFAFASVFAGHKFSAPVQAAAREGVGWQAAAARVRNSSERKLWYKLKEYREATPVTEA